MEDRKPHKRQPTKRGAETTPNVSAQPKRSGASRSSRTSRANGGQMPPFLDRATLAERLPAIDDPAHGEKQRKGPFGALKAKRAQEKKSADVELPQDGADNPEEATAKHPRRGKGRGPFIALSIIVGLVVTLAITYAVLSNTSAFVISSIECEDTEHITADAIATLAAVPEGTTLLNYDAAIIEENLKHNPWVGSVKCTRVFPDRLRIDVTERTVTALVPLSAGSVVWCLGTGNVWIEPIKVVPEEEQTMVEAALTAARERGCLLITDVPSNVSPVAGEPADGEVFGAISQYQNGFSDEFWQQVVSVSAPSVEGLACTLESGVEISLGTPTNIPTKEGIVEQLLAKYPNRITYINVRVPGSPSYRMIDSESVQEGTGVMGGGYGPNADEPIGKKPVTTDDPVTTDEGASTDEAGNEGETEAGKETYGVADGQEGYAEDEFGTLQNQ